MKYLLQIICTRTNDELKQIAEAYEKTYGKDLEKAIESEVSGDYRSLLILFLSVGRRVSFSHYMLSSLYKLSTKG